ncbi:hypothetical protein QWL27_25540 [Streptomyces thermocarboxydus]|uniref:hypothetical protein n=1 Tax=Streptomyces thermocarboxydus TaxID=59299 RepID=UPI0025C9C41A|nr:hypothetical protein [Streptomyces thermocarboxydus]
MPEAPRRTTQDTWIPNGPDAPAPGPASADPGHEAATLDHKTEAGRRTEPSTSRGGADSTVGFGETDAPRGSGTGSAGTESPLVAAHPQPGERTSAGTSGTPSGTPGTSDRTSVPGPDGTGAHTPGPHGTPTEGDGHHGPDSRLLADDTCDRLSAQLRQAVAGFVDRPRDAVEEADLVLHEITERLSDALTERRRTLTRNWKTPASGDPKKGDAATAADTEQLRLALRDYRELAERLLHV